MNAEEMAEFRNGLRETAGNTIRVRVEKHLNNEERKALINHIRHQSKDFDATIEVIEPSIIDFEYEVLSPDVPNKTRNDSVAEVISKGTDALSSDNHSASTSKNGKDSKNWVYGEHLVVMQNRLLNAITNLEHNERRLIMFLSGKVRKRVDKYPDARTFEVTALEFAKEYNLDVNGAYKTLGEISDSLLEKAFWFYDFKKNGVANRKGSSWVAECEYMQGKGRVSVTLTDTVTEMLTVFDKTNPFTKYERQYIVELGSHGIILFELATSCLYLQGKKKAYTVNYLREKFNCRNKYPKMADFRRNIIDKSINEVERCTPLRISYTKNKVGREISEIVLNVHDTNSEVDINNIVRVFSKQEISKFAWKLKDKHDVVGNFPQAIRTPNDTQKEVERRMADSSNYELYLGYLKKHTDFDENVHLRNLRKGVKKTIN